MASIQQALNNMLSTAGVAAGFYAHSPEGHKRAEIKQLEKEQSLLDKKVAEGISSTEDVRRQAEIADKLFTFNPTPERLDISEEYAGKWEKARKASKQTDDLKATAESKAIESLGSKLDTISERLAAFEKRKVLLKNRNKGGKQ